MQNLDKWIEVMEQVLLMKCPKCGSELKESKYGLFLECEKGDFAIEESAISSVLT